MRSEDAAAWAAVDAANRARYNKAAAGLSKRYGFQSYDALHMYAVVDTWGRIGEESQLKHSRRGLYVALPLAAGVGALLGAWAHAAWW